MPRQSDKFKMNSENIDFLYSDIFTLFKKSQLMKSLTRQVGIYTTDKERDKFILDKCSDILVDLQLGGYKISFNSDRTYSKYSPLSSSMTITGSAKDFNAFYETIILASIALSYNLHGENDTGRRNAYLAIILSKVFSIDKQDIKKIFKENGMALKMEGVYLLWERKIGEKSMKKSLLDDFNVEGDALQLMHIGKREFYKTSDDCFIISHYNNEYFIYIKQ